MHRKKRQLKNRIYRGMWNTCLTDCVARYFNVAPWNVPFFIGNPRWQRRLEDYYAHRGLKLRPYPYKKSLLSNKRKLYLVTGVSPRSKAKAKNDHLRQVIYHAVLYRGTKPFFDPNGAGKFLKRPKWVWIVTPLKKKK